MPKKKPATSHKLKTNPLHRLSSTPNFNKTVMVVVIAGLVILGYYLIVSRAASPNTSLEPEKGTLIGKATVVNDSTASGGKYIQLGQVDTGGGGGTGGGGTGGSATDPILPTISGACPTIKNGQVAFPSDSNRVVHIRMDSNPSTKGPLIFLWHGAETADTTDQQADSIASTLLQQSTVTNLINSGAVLAIMKMYAPSTWDSASSWSTTNRDLNLVDAVTACSAQQNLIDPKRIHSTGMSWGGYQTSRLGYLRSNYIASTVVMSGGFTGTPPSGTVQRPANKFATITSIGTESAGELKMVKAPLEGYRDYAKSNGQFVLYCKHSGGHFPIPSGGPMQQRFFQDHYYGMPNAYGSSALPVPPYLNYCVKY